MKNYPDRHYETVSGLTYELGGLIPQEQKALSAVLEKYEARPEWSNFAAWWLGQVAKCGLSKDSLVFSICDDLEARLGIEQGKVAPPDYRDYLSSLIKQRFGSRYKFSQATGIDQGQLSRVLTQQADISIGLLQKMLSALKAVLVIEGIDTVRKRMSPVDAEQLFPRTKG